MERSFPVFWHVVLLFSGISWTRRLTTGQMICPRSQLGDHRPDTPITMVTNNVAGSDDLCAAKVHYGHQAAAPCDLRALTTISPLLPIDRQHS